MALTKIGKEGITGISNSSDGTAITITSDEHVGIGTTNGAHKLNLQVNAQVHLGYNGTSANTETGRISTNSYAVNNTSYSLTEINFVTSSANGYTGGIQFRTNSVNSTNSRAAVRMTIDSAGLVGIGTTVEPQNGTAGVQIRPAGSIRMGSASTSGHNMIEFNNPNGFIGGIVTNGSGTAFNTSSDYRLKENVVYDWDATTRLKQLKPARFNFIVDDTTTVDGFLAHEAQAVVPEAVSVTKDAMRDEEYEVTPAVEEVRDADDNLTTEAVEAVMGTRSVPDYQGIDQSKLVPLLVKTIQELEARLTAGGL